MLRDRVFELWRDFGWREASGSVGDLGTFVPLLVGLTVECGLDIGTTLIFTGLYNVATALMFDVPMPLQPMKTIAAVALSSSSSSSSASSSGGGGGGGMTVPEIVAAGIFVSVVVMALGIFGLMDTFNRVTPKAVIHGMQLGLGLLLCTKGYTLAVYTSKSRDTLRPALGADGLLLGAAALVFTMAMSAPRRALPKKKKKPVVTTTTTRASSEGNDDETVEFGGGSNRDDAAAAADDEETEENEDDAETRENSSSTPTPTPTSSPSPSSSSSSSSSARTTPVALILVALGVVISLCRPGSLADLRIGPSTPTLLSLTPRDVARGVLMGGLPQLPLTTLNSVIAVCALAGDLFPDRSTQLAPKNVAVSVGAMNLAGCALGVMPCCHGAGGLAAHYHFGARRGAAVAFLGLCKLFLGLVFGGSLLTLLRKFPAGGGLPTIIVMIICQP